MTGSPHLCINLVFTIKKVGSRKIFAVLESQLNRIKGKGRKRDVIHISESESDDELPPSKKGKHIPVQLDQLTLG